MFVMIHVVIVLVLRVVAAPCVCNTDQKSDMDFLLSTNKERLSVGDVGCLCCYTPDHYATLAFKKGNKEVCTIINFDGKPWEDDKYVCKRKPGQLFAVLEIKYTDIDDNGEWSCESFGNSSPSIKLIVQGTLQLETDHFRKIYATTGIRTTLFTPGSLGTSRWSWQEIHSSTSSYTIFFKTRKEKDARVHNYITIIPSIVSFLMVLIIIVIIIIKFIIPCLTRKRCVEMPLNHSNSPYNHIYNSIPDGRDAANSSHRFIQKTYTDSTANRMNPESFYLTPIFN